MTQVIIYRQDDGTVAIVYPVAEAVNLLGIEAIALKDVPSGKPYKIVDSSDIPTDRSARHAWVVDEADLTDGIGADYGAGSNNIVVSWKDGKPVTVAADDH